MVKVTVGLDHCSMVHNAGKQYTMNSTVSMQYAGDDHHHAECAVQLERNGILHCPSFMATVSLNGDDQASAGYRTWALTCA